MTTPYGVERVHEPPTVAGLLDGLVDQGVHVAGDLVLGLADIDLIRVSLRLLITSEDTAQRTGVRAGQAPASPRSRAARLDSGLGPADATTPGRRSGPVPHQPRPFAGGTSGRHAARSLDETSRRGSRPVDADEREQLVRGVSQLVLTVVELIRELIERQAVRRVEAGNLTSEEVERLGVALQALEERMEGVKEVFGLSDEDLNLDLGPLGRLR